MRFILRAMLKGELTPLAAHTKVRLMRAYVDFCEREQLAHRQDSGHFALGHGKATLAAEPNPFVWGYPQNDGPPLEILTLMEVLRLTDALPLRDPELRRTTLRVWSRNLDYILRAYRDPAVERWEEVKALSHFSILAEMRAALKASLKVLVHLDEVPPRRQFSQRRREILRAITEIEAAIKDRHISADGYIRAHYGQLTEGSLVRNKDSALDMQVLMTSVYLNKLGEMSDTEHFYPPSHPLMRATFHRLKEAFMEKYPVNAEGKNRVTQEELRGLVFGRYPEDVQHFNGAPWFITTFAAVQYLVWDAIHIHRRGVEISNIDLNYFRGLNSGLRVSELTPGRYGPSTRQARLLRDGLIRLAKEVFYRATIHIGDMDLSLTEVLNPLSGFKEGIQHLTWSYVEYVKTVRMLRRAKMEFGLDLRLRLPEVSCETWLSPG